MAAAVRRGRSQRSVAKEYDISLLTVQRWLERGQGQRLDRVDWSDRSSAPHAVANRTDQEVEDLVLQVRNELREESALGEYGAVAIQAELIARGVVPVPCLRTINRILARHGAFDGRGRIRHQPPPPGWYLPDLAARRAELDQFDTVEGLVIKDGPQVEVLNVVSLHGGLVGSWPRAGMKAKAVRAAMLEHWRQWGLPDYAQFDNDTLFQGPHQHADAIGSVIRLCLSLAVVAVFVPPREFGFQAAIENYNGLWQGKVWSRFQHESLPALQEQSAKYVCAHRWRTGTRREAAPERRPFPESWELNLQAPLRGRVIFLRRTGDGGQAAVLGRTFTVGATWPHRLVRAEVMLDADVIRFYALRRRAPEQQPLLAQLPYSLPNRRFRE